MFQKENKNKILELFFDHPNKEFYLREVSRLTKTAPSGTFRILKDLEKEGIITKRVNKATTNFKLKLNEKVKKIKRLYNISSIYESGILDFLIKEYIHPEAIILFGSYSLGENDEGGDVDIAVITKKHKNPDLSKFVKYLNRNIHLLEVDLNKVSKEFKNSLANGIVLKGYLNLE